MRVQRLMLLAFLWLVATLFWLTRDTVADGSGPVNNLSCVNTGGHEFGPDVSSNGDELFLASSDELVVAQSQTASCPWSAPIALSSLNSDAADAHPTLSADGLTIYFSSNRIYGSWRDLFVATRPAKGPSDNWTSPTAVSELNHAFVSTEGPSLSSDSLTIYFCSDRTGGAGGFDIWKSTRASTSSSWATPAPVSELNSSANDCNPDISADGLMLLFESDRPGGCGEMDIWMASRLSTSAPFNTPTNLACKVNSASADQAPTWVTASLVYFQSNRSGGLGGSHDIWTAQLPSVGGIAELPEVAGQPQPAGRASGPGADVLASVAVAVAAGAVALFGGTLWQGRRARANRPGPPPARMR